MVGRRTDTRARIQQVALEMFTEQGYDKTTLREVADRLQITRPALYYHFKAKEDILTSVIEDLTASMEELVEWAHAQPATPEARRDVLRRIADLMDGSLSGLVRFAQLNESVMQRFPVGEFRPSPRGPSRRTPPRPSRSPGPRRTPWRIRIGGNSFGPRRARCDRSRAAGS